ncbi:MAG TPA: ABC transporter ATP-binding protein [Solirubrobacteraceae bacterium]|nr:ABC transporter ATP-binding protein [Solirubrobacteraceae bacterium]
MFAYLRPHKPAVVASIACLIVQSILLLAPFIVVEQLINYLQQPHGSFSRIVLYALAGVGLVAASGLVGILRGWLVLRITTSIVTDLRTQLVGRLLGQSVAYFTSNRGGELMSRLLNDVNVVEAALGDNALTLVGSVITAVASIVVMAVVQWRLAVVTVAILPCLALMLRAASGRVYRTRRDLQERLADFTAHSQEILSLSGIMLVKSFAREAAEAERSAVLADNLRRSDLRAGMTSRWIALGFQLGQTLAPLVLIVAGGWLIERRHATLGTLIAFISVLALRFGAALAGIGNGAVTVAGALPAWDRVFTILDEQWAIGDRPGSIKLENPVGAVRIEGVTYAYEGQSRPAIDGVSIDVAPGQLVALVGPSGAGKTTMTSLLARFYDPDRGSIKIDGYDLRELRRRSVAEAIGLVLQDTHLFNATLRENLLYARPDADEDALLRACRDAYLDALIAALPDGLNTMVGERGHRLSGGEKQRVAIARVILKDAPILILDEATSHLDSASEQFVQAALARLFAGRTSFVIAHRLSTVLAADTIVVLDRGHLVEQGSHAELLAAGGLYAGLYEIQFRGRDDDPIDDATEPVGW